MATRGESNIYLCSLKTAVFRYHDLEATCYDPHLYFQGRFGFLKQNNWFLNPALCKLQEAVELNVAIIILTDALLIESTGQGTGCLRKTKISCLEKEAPAD